MSINSENSHNCQNYLVKKYNETEHWNECKICNKEYDKVSHNAIDNGWSLGSATNCKSTNVHQFSCECGYSYTNIIGRSKHGNINHLQDTFEYVSYDYCNNCSDVYNYHECIKDDGSRISCNNLGKCNICGYNYSSVKGHTNTIKNIIEDVKCEHCNLYMGHSNEVYIQQISDTFVKLHFSINIIEGVTFQEVLNFSTFGNSVKFTNDLTTSGTNWIGDVTVTFNTKVENKGKITIQLNGMKENIKYIYCVSFDNISLDTEPPKIDTIDESNNDTWEANKEITISGTENYCGSVIIEIQDDKENIIYTGTTSVTDNRYSLSFTPEFEANEIGRNCKVIVTDKLENKTEQEFTIYKIDTIPPTPTSSEKIQENWAKSKNVIFTAIDSGIGDVSISFNSINDYEKAIVEDGQYSREYKIIGDVYTPKEVAIYYKDGLENTNIQLVTIDKLDNTAPTITNVSIHNNKLTIEANDIKEGLGEGSGVEKYRYITSTEKINNPEVLETAATVNVEDDFIVPNIDKVKYIYIVAEDLVGNTSEVYEYEVPQLILTSKINLETANGKGGVELDWSDYDLEDKYFVIYRKQENETEWETIVPLEQKLTGGKYTDTLGNDKAKPSTPTINIERKPENNNIQITQGATDTGTKYSYYIEAYDNTNNILISKSDVIN